jgi:cell pole-organizing protein PopZ
MSQTGPDPAATPEAAADPSMEDILASIRRILHDGSEEVQFPQEELAPSTAEPPQDVFELDHGMIIDEQTEPQAPSFAPEPDPSPQLQPSPPEADHLLAPQAAAAASASMGALVRVLGQRQTQVYRGGPTLEDIVRDEIRPLVKNWLDENLAPMVERMVRAEIERVTSRNL